MTKFILLLLIPSLANAATFVADQIIDRGLTASQAVVTDASKQLASQAIGNLTDAGTDGIVVTNGASSVFGSGTSFAQHVADTTHNGYLSSTDWNTFNGKQATVSFGAFGSTPNSAGGGISAGVITLQPADATNPGGVSTTTQTLAGAKTFSSTPTFSTMTAGSALFAGTSGILSQDNANFFYDSTNHDLLLNTTTQAGASTLVVKAKNSTVGGIAVVPFSGSEYWTLTATANDLYLIDPNSNRRIFDALNTGQIAWGLANANGAANLDNFLIKNANGVGATSTTFSVGKSTSQTGDLTDWYDTDGTTKLAKIDVAGKGFFSNLRDTALSTGVVHSDSSGDFTSSAVNLAGADVTGTLPVGNGGTGLATLTAHALYVGNGASAPTALAVGATNTVLHGNTGADPSYSAIVNADITNSTIDLTTKVTGVLPSANVGGARTINAQTGTTYTFVLGDGSPAGGSPLVTGSNAAAETFTVPPQSSVVWLSGTQIDVCQIGAGKLTLAQGSGVTINSLSSNKSIGGQYVCVTLVRTASDTWLLTGNLIP